jgi:hypothetical protein
MSELRALPSSRSASQELSKPAKPGIPRHKNLELCRLLAAGEVQRSELARRYHVTTSAITQFAQRNAARIDEIRANLDDEFAGLWIADKLARVEAYQIDYDSISQNNHHEWVKARTAILKAVAEELGQLPPRAQVVVAPVVHVIEGVNVNEELT